MKHLPVVPLRICEFLLLIFIFSQCCPYNLGESNINLETQKNMGQLSGKYFDTIAEYYEKGDFKSHTEYTAGLLKLMNNS